MSALTSEPGSVCLQSLCLCSQLHRPEGDSVAGMRTRPLPTSLACHSRSLWGSKHGLESTARSAWSAHPAACTFCQPRRPPPVLDRCSPASGPGRPPLRPLGTLGPPIYTWLAKLRSGFCSNAPFAEGVLCPPCPNHGTPVPASLLFIWHVLRPRHSSKPVGARLLRHAVSLEFRFSFICLVSIPAPTTPSIAWGRDSVCGTYIWTMPGPEELFSKQVLNEGRSLALCPGPAKPSLASGSQMLIRPASHPPRMLVQAHPT